MAGEISPDIMFLGVWQKMVRMGADGYRPVLMGEDGCIGKEGGKKEAKRAPHGRAGDVLQCMYTVQKKQEVGRDGHGGLEGTRGGIQGKQELRGLE